MMRVSAASELVDDFSVSFGNGLVVVESPSELDEQWGAEILDCGGAR